MKGTDLAIHYPYEARFKQLAIDTMQTEAELVMLEVNHKKSIRRNTAETAKIRADIIELQTLTETKGLSEVEEGKRRLRMVELAEQLSQAAQPEPVQYQLYRVRKQMLKHKLHETSRINSTLLVWTAQANRQN